MDRFRFSASGKLLLFGEYLVLRGGKALVLPLQFGQKLEITPVDSENVLWECFELQHKWLGAIFSPDLEIIETDNRPKATIVQKLLRLIHHRKPDLRMTGLKFRFDIDFDRSYGFGTSSTFVSLLSQWSGTDAYDLLEAGFGGSGFDVAAATAESPVIYQRISQEDPGNVLQPESFSRQVTSADIPESIRSKLLFVYTGQKQNSREEVAGFRSKTITTSQINTMNAIVENVLSYTDIHDFERLMEESENFLSEILGATPVQQRLFEDYPFAIKSLGAWGGDFVMATFRDEKWARNYFYKKGMQVAYNYRKIAK